jgi:cytidylate kinase
VARVIAIDGPSGAGKSTVSQRVAERLGFQYLDTGALYRAVGLHLSRKGIDPESPDEVIVQTLRDATVELRGDRVLLNGEDVSLAIRTPEGGHHASVFSARKPVRDHLFSLQQDAGRDDNIVAEGRDMTTVVFPDAWIKVYLDASEGGRAARRFRQLREKGVPITMEEAIRDVRDRDYRDKNRPIAPLRRADDAIYIDSTDMTLEEVIGSIVTEAAQQFKIQNSKSKGKE